MSTPLLELENVTIKFGGLTAVCELTTTVGEGAPNVTVFQVGADGKSRFDDFCR